MNITCEAGIIDKFFKVAMDFLHNYSWSGKFSGSFSNALAKYHFISAYFKSKYQFTGLIPTL